MATFPISEWQEFRPDTGNDSILITSDNQSIAWHQNVTTSDVMREVIEATTAPLDIDDTRSIETFLKSVRSRNVFTLRLYGPYYEYRGTLNNPNNVFRVNGEFEAGDAIISLTAMPTLNTMPNGTYVQFGNHSKVYQVIATSGMNMTILPTLREDVPSNTSIKLSNIDGEFRLENGGYSGSYSHHRRMTYNFRFIEELV